MQETPLVAVDRPAPFVQRVTLNRPEKRNAISNALRAELLEALRRADADDEVHVSIVRGAGPCFSSGPIWDLAKPVIAQIHGYAMAGGLELAGACDLAYAASDAALSHPVLRFAGLPDFAWFPVFLAPRHAMELHLTGRVYSGEEAARIGLVNQAFPPEELEARVLAIAQTIAETPPAVAAVNKRYVYTALEARGGRSVIRTGADLQAGPHLQGVRASGAELTAKIKAAQKK